MQQQDRPLIGIVGGTGELGRALARRWARAGYSVIIGSRRLASAEAAASALNRAAQAEGWARPGAGAEAEGGAEAKSGAGESPAVRGLEAGAVHGQCWAARDLREAIEARGRGWRQRCTDYGDAPPERVARALAGAAAPSRPVNHPSGRRARAKDFATGTNCMNSRQLRGWESVGFNLMESRNLLKYIEKIL